MTQTPTPKGDEEQEMTVELKACPREPTAEMIEAAAKLSGEYGAREGAVRNLVVRDWRAMFDAAPAVPQDMARELPWLVWSNEHNMFWAENRCGYTSRIEKAGRYTRAAAEAICKSANPRANSTIYEGTPPEICMPAPEALDAALARAGQGYDRNTLRASFEKILGADPVCGGRVSSSAVERLVDAAGAGQGYGRGVAAWLIEREDCDGLSYAMAARWDRDHSRAIRFSRRQDALAFAEANAVPEQGGLASGWCNYTRIAEHRWG